MINMIMIKFLLRIGNLVVFNFANNSQRGPPATDCFPPVTKVPAWCLPPLLLRQYSSGM